VVLDEAADGGFELLGGAMAARGEVGWVELQADDVAHLVDQQRIGRELEGFCAVGARDKARPIRLMVD
jgi:hypothetical protein